jgi:hypothetical protein
MCVCACVFLCIGMMLSIVTWHNTQTWKPCKAGHFLGSPCLWSQCCTMFVFFCSSVCLFFCACLRSSVYVHLCSGLRNRPEGNSEQLVWVEELPATDQTTKQRREAIYLCELLFIDRRKQKHGRGRASEWESQAICQVVLWGTKIGQDPSPSQGRTLLQG